MLIDDGTDDGISLNNWELKVCETNSKAHKTVATMKMKPKKNKQPKNNAHTRTRTRNRDIENKEAGKEKNNDTQLCIQKRANT